MVVVGLLLGGCGEQTQPTPVVCREGPDEVRTALRSAPDPVRLDGVALSACLGDETDGGALRDVGSAYLVVAIELADRAAREPEGSAALQLGYLAGALRRSAAGAQGVGYELGRRIRAEIGRVDTNSTAFRRGLRAGRRSG